MMGFKEFHFRNIIIFCILLFFVSFSFFFYKKVKVENFSQRDLLGSKDKYNIIYSEENDDPKLDTINPISDKAGGLRIGCYLDDVSRKVPYSGGVNRMSFEECQELATRRKHPFFAVQDGGYCWTSLNKERSMELGDLPDDRCALPNQVYENIQLGGGEYVNDLYITDSLPNVRMCGNLPPDMSENDFPIKGVSPVYRGKISEESQMLKPELGANCSHNMLNRWIVYQFSPDQMDSTNVTDLLSGIETKNKTKTSIGYCPDIDYVEFNPSACTDPTSLATCKNTPIDGYVSDINLCKNKFHSDIFYFNNLPVFKMLNETHYQIEKVIEDNSAAYSLHKTRIDEFGELVTKCGQFAVNILLTADPEYDASYVSSSDQWLAIIYQALKMKSDNPELTFQITQLEDHMKILIEKSNILRGLLNLKNMGCPCIKTDDDVLKCGPC